LIYLAAGIATIFGMVSADKLNFLKSYSFLAIGVVLYLAAFFLIFSKKQRWLK
jgi:hypothetical protein